MALELHRQLLAPLLLMLVVEVEVEILVEQAELVAVAMVAR